MTAVECPRCKPGRVSVSTWISLDACSFITVMHCTECPDPARAMTAGSKGQCRTRAQSIEAARKEWATLKEE